MLLKVSKNSTKSKAVSSYMLSGINIKRMIQDEMSENNVSDVSIIRVSKRPIFKVRERAEKDKEKEGSTAGNLPNKSFKIRSYTRKMKDGKEEESCEIFEKAEKIRNCRVNSNRIELFNLSKENREKAEKEQHIQTKIKEILQRQATIKCKGTNEIIANEPFLNQPKAPAMHYQQFDTEKYRDAAHKINVYFNPQFEDTQTKQTLLVVSMQGLHIHSRKVFKSSNVHDQLIKTTNTQKTFVSQQQIELLKMLSSRHYPDLVLGHTKVAFKVNTPQQLQQLRSVLQNSNISDYFCIFYPIKKHVECWNLYQIDGLMQNTHSIILLETKYKLKDQFPILSPSAKALFVATHYDNLVMLSRTISAIKAFLSQSRRQTVSVAQDIEDSVAQCSKQEKQVKNMIEFESSVVQFGVKEERIDINWSELNARLQFIINSREIKSLNSRHQNKSVCTSKENRNKRRILCQRDSNCPLSSFKNNRNLSFNSASVQQDKWDMESVKQESIDAMRESLLYCLRTERLKQVTNQNKPIKIIQIQEKNEKCDELEQITSYVRGSCCRSKTNHQLISELLKKNTVIHRQIEQYLASVAHLVRQGSSNNISVSNFIDRQEEQSQPIEQPLAIHAYKIL